MDVLLESMEKSQVLTGGHMVLSKNGDLLASIANGHICVSETQDPDRYVPHDVQLPTKSITSIRWSPASNRLALMTPNAIQILNFERERQRTKIDNGSGGFGRFVTVEWLSNSLLLVIWEFGKTSVFDLETGRITELGSVKSVADVNHEYRPGKHGCLTFLARHNGEDHLQFFFPYTERPQAAPKMRGMDARSLSWSPDGRWLAVLDSALHTPALNIYTADGNHFKAIQKIPGAPTTEGGMSTKSILWSPDSQLLAVSTFAESIALLNTRTFSPLAVVDHSTTIDQSHLTVEQQTPIWNESVSANNTRMYSRAAHPVSPPLSRKTPSEIPNEMGVAEMTFSSDGRYLATRDERMLSTVFVWDIVNSSPAAISTQHSNVRKLQWHPTRPSTLMIECGENIAYLWDLNYNEPPVPLHNTLGGTATFAWVSSSRQTKLGVLAHTKSSWQILWPEGRNLREDRDSRDDQYSWSQSSVGTPLEDSGEGEDSLLEALTGRKSTSHLAEDFHLADEVHVGIDEMDDGDALDDTFREKRKMQEVDPLDDSEIF